MKKRLTNALQSVGMGIAFAPGLADFSRMADLEALGKNLYIGEVLHKAVVEVNEEGTEAAAVTQCWDPRDQCATPRSWQTDLSSSRFAIMRQKLYYSWALSLILK